MKRLFTRSLEQTVFDPSQPSESDFYFLLCRTSRILPPRKEVIALAVIYGPLAVDVAEVLNV
jgi:hypothetical protein